MAGIVTELSDDALVLVVTTGMEEYQSKLVRGISSVLAPLGLSTVAVSSVPCSRDPDTAGLPETLAAVLRRAGAAGVIATTVVAPGEEQALLAELADQGLPTVLLGLDGPDAAVVRADNVSGMRALMAHLLDDCGVRQPALVRGFPHHRDTIERERVYREELTARGLPVDEALILDGEYWHDRAFREVQALLAAGRRPDAVVACNDDCAVGAMRALAEAGLKVPDDVRVTGFDDDRQAASTWPGITTVDQDLPAQGRAAAQLLLRRLAGETGAASVLVPSRLVVRGSTAGHPDDRRRLAAALTMSDAVQDRLEGQDAVLAVNRALLRCRNLPEVVEGLGERLGQLGLERCFVVVHERLFDSEATGFFRRPGDGEDVRLVLDFRDGRLQPCPDEPFPLPRMLPDRLRAELNRGTLAMQPLTAGEAEFGYVVFEQRPGPLSVSEMLHNDLSRTLEAVFSTGQLREHVAGLERMVNRRTSQLEAEIDSRRAAQHDLVRANAELQRLNTDLQQSLMRDGLTRIANRTAFQAHLEDHWDTHQEDAEELALLMIDVDLFKPYNDHYGHLAGDETLRQLAALLQESLREPTDLASRYGGEEFAVVLPHSGREAATAVAGRFRALLAQRAIPHAASHVAPVVTASIGIAVARIGEGLAPREVIEAADRALYRAKARGRDQVAVADAADVREARLRYRMVPGGGPPGRIRR